MGKSIRKTPIMGHTKARSEKKDKQLTHKKFRRHNKLAIKAGRLERIWDEMTEAYNTWSMAKDGKGYVRNPEPKWMRK